MTTSVHIVNFGPQAVIIKRGAGAPDETVYSHGSFTDYVYGGKTLEIVEAFSCPQVGCKILVPHEHPIAGPANAEPRS